MTARLLTALILIAAAAPSAAEQGDAQDGRLVRTFQVRDGDVLELQNLSGRVSIDGVAGNELRIEARTRRARGAEDAAETEIVQRPGRVQVRTRGRSRGRQPPVDYTVHAPAGMALELHNVSGDVTVRGLDGRTTLQAISGDIRAASLGQLVSAQTVSGSIQVTSSRASRDLSLSSVSGHITLEDVAGEAIKITSTSGRVQLADVAATTLDVTLLSGPIAFSGPLSPTGRYTLTTHSGQVRFEPRGDVGFTLDAGSFSGAIRTDLPLTLTGAAGRDRRARGTVGDGAASVAITTFSGTITIAR